MFTLSPQHERSNALCLYQDIFWMGAAFVLDWYFLQVYAIRLGATALDLGLLTSLRAFFMVIGSTLSNRWRARYRNPVAALAIPTLAYRVLLLLVPALIVYLPPAGRVNGLIVTVILSALPTGIAQGVFLGMMRYALTESGLARVVARRSILMNITVLIWALAFGQFFEHSAFPGNYQVGFVIAFGASVFSLWNVLRVKTPDSVVASVLDTPHPQPLSPQGGQGHKSLNVWKNAAFVRFSVIVVAVNLSVFMAAPLVQLHLVRGLGADDGWISFFGMFEMVAGAIPMLRIDWLTRRFGNARLTVIAAFFTALHTLILALTPILAPYLLAVLLYGAGWWVVNVVLYNWLVDIVPHEHFAPYAAAFQILINASLFVGPLIGTLLIENWMSIPMALLVITACRFGASLLAWLLVRGKLPKSDKPVIEAQETLS
ncbi:MAG TPA: MFS transporter [Aggregatilineales bacterium]|nr:MFS transporter [Aggregatilineales bacterium]